MRRVLLAAAALLAAVLLQVTVLDNLPLPGGSGPDLVLVVVVALGLTGGPMTGMLAGFLGGLALDIAPPASHLIGLAALAYCLTGYLCGRLHGGFEKSPLASALVVAAGAAAGELLYAAAGIMFGDPDITWAAVRQVLPASVLYDALLSPFVLYAVVLLTKAGVLAAERARDHEGVQPASRLGGAVLSPGVATGEAVRSAGGGRVPRLRAAAARQSDGWIGRPPPRPGQAAAQFPARKPLSLRLRGGQAGSAAGGQVSRRLPVPAVHLRFGSRRRDGAVGTSLNGSAGAGSRSGLRAGQSPLRAARGPRLRGAAFRSGQPSRVAGSVGTAQGTAGGLARPGSGPKPRSGAFRGGPSAISSSGRGLAPRQVNLRLGGGRKRDGAIGGSVLGRGRSRRPGTLGAGGGAGAAPRFRSGTGRSLLGRRGSLGGRRGGDGGLGGGSLGRSGLRGSGLGRSGLRRGRLGRRAFGRAGARPGRRSAVWRIGSKRGGPS